VGYAQFIHQTHWFSPTSLPQPWTALPCCGNNATTPGLLYTEGKLSDYQSMAPCQGDGAAHLLPPPRSTAAATTWGGCLPPANASGCCHRRLLAPAAPPRPLPPLPSLLTGEIVPLPSLTAPGALLPPPAPLPSCAALLRSPTSRSPDSSTSLPRLTKEPPPPAPHWRAGALQVSTSGRPLASPQLSSLLALPDWQHSPSADRNEQSENTLARRPPGAPPPPLRPPCGHCCSWRGLPACAAPGSPALPQEPLPGRGSPTGRDMALLPLPSGDPLGGRPLLAGALRSSEPSKSLAIGLRAPSGTLALLPLGACGSASQGAAADPCNALAAAPAAPAAAAAMAAPRARRDGIVACIAHAGGTPPQPPPRSALPAALPAAIPATALDAQPLPSSDAANARSSSSSSASDGDGPSKRPFCRAPELPDGEPPASKPSSSSSSLAEARTPAPRRPPCATPLCAPPSGGRRLPGAPSSSSGMFGSSLSRRSRLVRPNQRGLVLLALLLAHEPAPPLALPLGLSTRGSGRPPISCGDSSNGATAAAGLWAAAATAPTSCRATGGSGGSAGLPAAGAVALALTG
jgi:hypothetical protein